MALYGHDELPLLTYISYVLLKIENDTHFTGASTILLHWISQINKRKPVIHYYHTTAMYLLTSEGYLFVCILSLV